MFPYNHVPLGEVMPRSQLEGSPSLDDADPVLFADPYPFLNTASSPGYSLSPYSERSSYIDDRSSYFDTAWPTASVPPLDMNSWAATTPICLSLPPAKRGEPAPVFASVTAGTSELGTVPCAPACSSDPHANFRNSVSSGSLNSAPPSPASSASNESEEEIDLKKPKPRGRPRLNSGSSSSVSKRCKRQPHNLVERRYREGINSQLEKLRRVIPTLPRSQEESAVGHSRPSKAIVLAAAIEYITETVVERRMLAAEIERLKIEASARA
ncbi:hypothetical protein P154DRAFT_292564 [Amniculicola lignicola CBS 123094]|uniref:BHLH domain-containing protein n=1 Tax=Amniculicola lignicola CBS 123094 TaxID=1392246 RepID=A0A6A5W7F3_9PLEO|nr:hypothetical protein P154DRAFT_292564 [Amniculicola lignicola CBS 123094]